MSDQPVIKRKPMWLYFLGGVVLLVVLVFLLVGNGIFVKTMILPRVASQLNSDLVVDDVSFSPFSSLSIQGLKLTPKGDEPLFTAKEVRVRYSLFSILGGNIKLDEVTLDSPQFTIVQRSPTDSNLAKLLNASPKTKDEPAKPSSGTPQIDIRNVAIKDATFRITEKTDVTEVSGFNLTIDQLRNGTSGKLTLSGKPRIQKGADQLAANFQGTFDVALTPELLPGGLKGALDLGVQQAAGAFKDLANLAAGLQADASPTEIRDLQLAFKQNGQSFGAFKISGPLDLQKKEVRLNYEIQSIDRRVLGLVGAGAGLDFGQTVVSAKGTVDLAKQGQVVASKGRLAADRFSLAMTNGATPVLDLGVDYQVSVNLPDQAALIQKLDIDARQAGRGLVAGGLDRPMSISWGKSTPGFRESAFKLGITNLNLADWKSFIGPTAPLGLVSTDLKIQAERDGRVLAFELGTGVQDLAVAVGTNRLDQTRVAFNAKGTVEDFRSVAVESYKLVIERLGRTLISASGLATYQAANQEIGAQTTVDLDLPGLLTAYPVPDLGAAAGKLKVAMEFSQKAGATNLAASVNLTGFTGRYGNMDFRDYTAGIQLTGNIKQGLVSLQRANFSAQTGFAPGGSVDLDGRYDLAKKTGNFSFKSVGLSQSALGPFVAAALKPNELKSVAIDLNGTANYDAAGASSVATEIKVSNLVVDDPTGRLPKTPFGASLGLDASMLGQKLDLKKVLLTLDKTARADNQLLISGSLDLATNNAAGSALSIRSEGLDLTSYYDLFAGKPAPAGTAPEKPAAPVTATPGADPNQEPAPVTLPFKKFDGDVNIARLYLRDVAVTNFVTKLAIRDGSVAVNPLSLNLNGAPVSLTANANLGVPGYQYDVNLDANGIPVAPLAKSFGAGEKVLLNGAVTAKTQIKGAGITGANLRRNLAGTVDVNASGLDYQVELSKNRFVKFLVPILVNGLRLGNISQSPVQSVSAKMVAGNGNVDVSEVRAASAIYVVSAKGQVQLADVLTNSPVNLPISIALVKDGKLDPLPDFLTIVGTVGDLKKKIDPVGSVALATRIPGGVGDVIGNTLSSVTAAGNKLTGGVLGNIIGAKTNAATAGASTNTLRNAVGGIVGNLLGGTNAAAGAATNKAGANTKPGAVNNLLRGFLQPNQPEPKK